MWGKGYRELLEVMAYQLQHKHEQVGGMGGGGAVRGKGGGGSGLERGIGGWGEGKRGSGKESGADREDMMVEELVEGGGGGGSREWDFEGIGRGGGRGGNGGPGLEGGGGRWAR